MRASSGSVGAAASAASISPMARSIVSRLSKTIRRVSGGSAFVYGATIDNTTNDPSIQFARVVFAIL